MQDCVGKWDTNYFQRARGQYLFHATLEHNSYLFKPSLLPTSSRILQQEEIALASTTVHTQSADLWHLRMGHLNYQDMCRLRTRATGMQFSGEPCFCQTCVLAKMKRTPFQNRGVMGVKPKQNLCFDVSGPFPTSRRETVIRLMQSAKRQVNDGEGEVNSSRMLPCF